MPRGVYLRKKKKQTMKEKRTISLKPAKKAIKKITRSKKIDWSIKLQEFMRKMTEQYPRDDWAPGVVISSLQNGQWYGAVYQYPKGQQRPDIHGINRVKLNTAIDPTFDEMVENLISPWKKGFRL